MNGEQPLPSEQPWLALLAVHTASMEVYIAFISVS
jgi:hypothetical protein